MNITDVDDKIILAARQQHLLSQFLAEHQDVDAIVRQTTSEAFKAYLRKNLPLVSPDTAPEGYEKAAEAAYGWPPVGRGWDHGW